MTSHHLHEIERMANRAGFFKKHRPGGNDIGWLIECGVCKTYEWHAWSPDTGTDRMIKTMRNKGWLISPGARPICTKCAHPRKHNGTHTEGEKTMNAPLQSSAPNMKLIRSIMAMLNDHFVEESRTYAHGYSDEKIAKETGAALTLVQKIRGDAFGELAEDPEIAKMRDAIGQADDVLIKAIETVDALKKRFEQFLASRQFAK